MQLRFNQEFWAFAMWISKLCVVCLGLFHRSFLFGSFVDTSVPWHVWVFHNLCESVLVQEFRTTYLVQSPLVKTVLSWFKCRAWREEYMWLTKMLKNQKISLLVSQPRYTFCPLFFQVVRRMAIGGFVWNCNFELQALDYFWNYGASAYKEQ